MSWRGGEVQKWWKVVSSELGTAGTLEGQDGLVEPSVLRLLFKDHPPAHHKCIVFMTLDMIITMNMSKHLTISLTMSMTMTRVQE